MGNIIFLIGSLLVAIVFLTIGIKMLKKAEYETEGILASLPLLIGCFGIVMFFVELTNLF